MYASINTFSSIFLVICHCLYASNYSFSTILHILGHKYIYMNKDEEIWVQITIDFSQIRRINIKKRSISINFREKRRVAEDESKKE